MERKTAIVVVLFALLAAGSVAARPGDVVVSERPLRGVLAAAATEKLRIGADALGDGTMMVVDRYALSPADGSIYLLDAKEFALHVFDPSGRHVRDLRISKGQGPGEMEGRFPQFVRAYPRPEGIWVEDSFALALLDGQGKMLRKMAKEADYDRIQGVSSDAFLAIRQETRPGLRGDPLRAVPKVQHLQLERWDGTVLARYFSSDRTGGWGNFWTAGVSDDRITPRIVFDDDAPGRRVVHASSDAYVLTVADLEGRPLRTIRREFQPRRITAEMRRTILASPYFREQVDMMRANGQDFMKMMDLNQSWDRLNPILDVQFLGDGMIGVFVLKDAAGRFETDVFDPQGRWRVTLRFPDPAQALSHPRLRGRRLCGLEIDSDGEPAYVEYLLPNVPAEILASPSLSHPSGGNSAGG